MKKQIQRDEVTFPKSHSNLAMELGYNSKLSHSKAPLLPWKRQRFSSVKNFTVMGKPRSLSTIKYTFALCPYRLFLV